LESKQQSMPDYEGGCAAAPVPARQMLPPKGACWYCDRPLDNVRRFCGKDCAAAFEEEAQYTR
jgi:hypothetical protein